MHLLHQLVPCVDRLDVPALLDGAHRVVRHAQLLALIDVGRALHHVQAGGEHLRAAHAAGLVPVAAKAGDAARLVVVVPVEAVPGFAVQRGLPAGEHGLELGQARPVRAPLAESPAVDFHMLKLEDHVQLAAVEARVAQRLLRRRAGSLTDGHDVVAAEHLPVHLADVLVLPRAVADIHLRASVRDERLLGLADHVDHVHAEAVDALVKPPAHHVVDALAHARLMPVEVSLFVGEHVQVVFAGRLVLPPGGAGEGAAQPVGRAALKRRAPDVEAALVVCLVPPGLAEPRVLRRGVVDHQIHDDAQSARVRRLKQRLKVLHRAEFRRDLPVVADVVAAVHAGILVDRVEPDHVCPQRLDVVEPLHDAAQIAHAVPVAVLKALGIDLIDDRLFEPITHPKPSHSPARRRQTPG